MCALHHVGWSEPYVANACLELFDRFWPSLRIQRCLHGEETQGEVVLGVGGDRCRRARWLRECRPLGSGTTRTAQWRRAPPLHRRSLRPVDHRDGGVTPVGELHQSTFQADHGEAVDDADRPFDVPVLDRPPMSLAEVGQLLFDEIRPTTEARPDTASTDRAGKLREP